MDKSIRDKYQAVIGLEVHVQLLTNSKAYSDDINEYGASPNSNISAITLGHPGTLPFVNERTIEFAVKLGLACGCKIASEQHFARKNYFYPDLPKGYQITQDKTPICTGGKIIIKTANDQELPINLTRIHMEEDAGKSIHDVDLYDTLVDLNRAGVPLLEIVSEPDLRSSQQAYDYLMEVRKLVRYLDICDGNMEEGSMRCDANISVNLKGAKEFGTKVEVKNMNSMRNVQKAIEFEINRQINCIEKNEVIAQETRSFDALNNSTLSMRTKEAANDYRYFPEPDLPFLHLEDDYINQIKEDLPQLPRELFKKYTNTFKLSSYDASNIIENKEIAIYYEKIIEHTNNYKVAANWLMGDIKSFLNEKGISILDFPISPKTIALLIKLIEDGKISNTTASQKIFPELLISDQSPFQVAEKLNLIQENNEDVVDAFVNQVITENENEVMRYKNGEKQLIGFFMGKLMKISKGKVDPKTANLMLRNKLDS